MTDVVHERNAEHYVWGGNCDGWHLLKSPGLSVIKERVPSGSHEVRHAHQHAHQFFYILSGRATLEADGEVLTLHPHEGCSIPPGVAHRLSNEDADDLVFILVSAPPAHGDRVVMENSFT